MFLGSSVVGQLYGGAQQGGSAFTPPQTTYPENNQTVTAAAFGPQGGGGGGRISAGHKASWVATAAFITLFVIWWGLPS